MSVTKPLPHDAAALHVTGQARYIDDIPTPAGTLHLAFGLSTVAHGEIASIDLSAVRAAPGVVLVIGPDDLTPMPDCSPSLHDEPLLATGHGALCRPAGVSGGGREPSRRAQGGAAGQGALSRAARAAEHRRRDGGRQPVRGRPGDLGQGRRGGGDRRGRPRGRRRFEIGGQEHFYLEGQAALALPQEGGDMVVHSSTQHPTEIQHKVAHALGVPMNAVRCEVRRMGGGFGGKESQGNALAIACAVAARATGRPCKMRYDRDDDMVITGKRHDFRINYRVRFRRGRAGCWGSSSCSSRAAAGRRICRCRSPTGRCCMPTTPISCPTSASKATGCAPTPSPPPPIAASAGRRAWSGSSG